MKPKPRPESALLKRFKRAASLHRTRAQFAARLERRGRRVWLSGTKISFTRAEIKRLPAMTKQYAKIAQSDVPDNMLALLTALRATAARIP